MSLPLPVPLSPLVGRQAELASVDMLLRTTSTRLVTITGPGGVGKTRFTLEMAHELNEHFASGCCWISLASVEDATGVAAALVSALDIQISLDQSAVSALCAHFAQRDTLLVIDNFEQVIEAAPLLTEILQACSSLRIIVTSRSLLNISGEHLVALGPLDVPEEVASPGAVYDLHRFSAVRLFLERAAAATGSFVLTPENAGDVVTICRALDGLPLALELAAARLRHLPLAVIVARLEDRLGLLVGGPRDRPARHQALRAAIDWSYRLLEPGAQALFRRLAALPGGATLETAHALGDATPGSELETLERLSTLIDVSLVVRLPDPLGEPRYGMLETIRQFGLWHLRAEGEEHETLPALSTYFTDLARRARQELGGPDQKRWVDRLEAERANFRAACEWAILANSPDTVFRLGNMLLTFWIQRANPDEGRGLLKRALALPGPWDEVEHANAVFNLGIIDLELHDHRSAREAFEACLRSWDRIGDRDGVACAHNELGLIDSEEGAYKDATRRFQLATEIWQEIGKESGVAIMQLNLGMVALYQADARRAAMHLDRARSHFLQLNEVDRAAHVTFRLGQVACLDGRLDEAQALFRESHEVFTRIGDRDGEADVLYAMGHRAWLAGVEHEALKHLQDSLALRHALASRDGTVECVNGIAAIAAARGNAADAAKLLGATAAYRARIGSVPPGFDRQVIERAWTAVAARLTAPELDASKAAGEALSLEEVTLTALRLLSPPEQEAPPGVLEKLSTREQEVFALLARYMTDREIAERLFLSHRTVERHVGSILAKLEVRNRREAAALGALRAAS
ncbi:MAG: tetratricopeptide repeat protein [Thermomicrobiales bacterium]